MDMLEVGAPMPAAMGRCADLYHDVRELRLSMEKEVEQIQKRENEIKEHLIENLSKGQDTGAAGLRYRAQIVTKDVVKVNDWAAVHAMIQKTGRFDFLQKRLADKAVAEYMETDKKLLPGTEVVHVPSVSVTKI